MASNETYPALLKSETNVLFQSQEKKQNNPAEFEVHNKSKNGPILKVNSIRVDIQQTVSDQEINSMSEIEMTHRIIEKVQKDSN